MNEQNPVLHIRLIAPDQHIDDLAVYLIDILEDRYEVLEATSPRTIIGDMDNKKVYISIRRK